MTNSPNPRPVGLEGYGLSIVGTRPIPATEGRRWRTPRPTLPRPRFERPARVLIVVAPFYRDIADALLAGARGALDVPACHHETVEVPGALELPTAIRLAPDGAFDGFVALGCVIRGETSHYETVCSESSRGLMTAGLAAR